MNWGKGIFLAFILFASGLIVMLYITLRQDIGLVAKDYYKQELTYQDQIERIKNYNELAYKPEIKQQREVQQIELSFPAELIDELISGEIHFFRPSSSTEDIKFNIAINEDGKQYINIATLERGMWRVKLNWKDTSKEYYKESILIIG
ncbi:MAG TPA: FixH family protein [Cyclobacteriaceae bacterium]|nr:FixH family protein [Cyclobacteriaceae bacterium]